VQSYSHKGSQSVLLKEHSGMSSYELPDWDEADEINIRDILPSPVMFSQRSHHNTPKQSRYVEPKPSQPDNDSISSTPRQTVYNPVSAERDIIMQKDLQLLECKRVFGIFSTAMSTLHDVMLNVNDSFENQGDIAIKVRHIYTFMTTHN
jgi:type II secretory pathway component PulC